MNYIRQKHNSLLLSRTMKQKVNIENISQQNMLNQTQLNGHKNQEYFPQQIIKELTIKNQILTQQLTQYKLLVQNLQNKIIQITNKQHLQPIHHDHHHKAYNTISLQRNYGLDINNQIGKLQTIEEQLNSLSDIQTNSRRKVSSQRQQDLLQTLWNILREDDQLDDRMTINYQINWKIIQQKIIQIKNQNIQLHLFIQYIWQMKDKIDPSEQNTLISLWNWLKKIGSNYKTLIQYYKDNVKESSNTKIMSKIIMKTNIY